MKRILSTLLALALFALINSTAHAANISKGVQEVSGDFNVGYTYSTQESFMSTEYGASTKKETDSLSGTIRVGYGYFVTDNIQIGASLSETMTTNKPYSWGTPEAYTANTYQTALDANAKYHFLQFTKMTVPVVPFAGVQAGYVHVYNKFKNYAKQQTESNSDTIGYGGMAGAKVFFSENMALNAEFNYRHFDVEIYKDMPKVKTDDLRWLVGLSYYFGK